MGIFYAVRNRNQSAKDMKGTMVYMLNKEKTLRNGIWLNSGYNCSVPSVYNEMMATKERYKKTDQRQFYQFVQSFPSDTALTREQVHQLGLEFVQKQFPDFECLVSTHCDTANLHNHILVNSVSFATGKKLHQNHDDLLHHRQVNDQLCLQFGETPLPTYQKGKKNRSMSNREYRSAKKGKSWKIQLMNTIDDCMKFARNKQHFIYLMESEGYQVLWTDSRKYITYTHPDGGKARCNKLHDSKYTKEMMEREFRMRGEIIAGRFKTDEQTSASMDPKRTGFEHNFVKSAADMGQAEHNGKPVDDTEQSHQGDPVQPTHQERTGEDAHHPEADAPDTTTGWEEEREMLFAGGYQTSTVGVDTGDNLFDMDVADLVADVASLARAVGEPNNSAPVMDSTTQIVTTERKKAVGQKDDDHEDQSYKMSM